MGVDKTTTTHWHHSPSHLFLPNSAYIVTAGTYKKQSLLDSSEKLAFLQSLFFELMKKYKWQPQAWCFLSNHYHFIALAPENPKSLKPLIRELHSRSAREINRLDNTPGRKIWHSYWDTCITYESSYFARLNYVHHNAAKHGVVQCATNYPFCSAEWFERNAEIRFFKKVKSFKYDTVKVPENF